MSTHSGRWRVFISAAEPSADQHAAALIRRTRELQPDTHFLGVAGPEMIEAGCEPVFEMSKHAAMLLGAVRLAGRAVRMFQACDRLFQQTSFDGAVVVDSPTLHLPLAKRIRDRGFPLMYYIAPQLWAWGAHRMYKLRHHVDELAVILPFEADYFRAQGVNATFVGHPSASRIASLAIDESEIAGIRRHGSPVIGLLPGSRGHVVEAVLPDQLETARRIAKEFPKACFPVSVTGGHASPALDTAIRDGSLNVFAVPDRFHEIIRASDVVLVASGTAALEVALHHTPMVVMYKASRMFYQLVGRWMIRTPHLSLPNILAGRRVVPEFMPYYSSTVPIADAVIELLRSDTKRRGMSNELREVVAPLHNPAAGKDVATLLLEMIGERSSASQNCL